MHIIKSKKFLLGDKEYEARIGALNDHIELQLFHDNKATNYSCSFDGWLNFTSPEGIAASDALINQIRLDFDEHRAKEVKEAIEWLRRDEGR